MLLGYGFAFELTIKLRKFIVSFIINIQAKAFLDREDLYTVYYRKSL